MRFFGEIISRKYTQFSEITEETGLNYLRELVKKYKIDTQIANVPTSKKLLEDLIKEGNPTKLQGNLILEIPVQRGAIPQSILDFAKKEEIIIRDINNKIYR